MRKYKINRNKKDFKAPSDDVINKYKNFDQLRAKYDLVTKRSKTPLYKNRKIFFFLILIILLAYLLSRVT